MFMMGLIAGGVASIAMVIYVNVNATLHKGKDHNHGKHHHGHKSKKGGKDHINPSKTTIAP